MSTRPMVPRRAVRQSALQHIVDNFFEGLDTQGSRRTVGATPESSFQMKTSIAFRNWCTKARKGNGR